MRSGPRPPRPSGLAEPTTAGWSNPPATDLDEASAPSLGEMLGARVGQLAPIFVAVTILVLGMSLVANAMR
jgi:hypothetical protein